MKHIGEYLKQRRCEKNITLEEVASQTGIREQYLTALESGDFEDSWRCVYQRVYPELRQLP